MYRRARGISIVTRSYCEKSDVRSSVGIGNKEVRNDGLQISVRGRFAKSAESCKLDSGGSIVIGGLGDHICNAS